MAYTVDNLQIEVATQSGKAVNALHALTNALRELKSVTKVSIPSKLADSIKSIGDAVKGIDIKDIEKLERLGYALQTLSSIRDKIKIPKTDLSNLSKAAKEATEITKSPEKQGKALKDTLTQIDAIESGTANVKDLVNIISGQAFKASPLIAGINKVTEGIRSKLQNIKKLTDALGRVAFYRAIRTAIKEITDAFSEGLKNAYAFSKQDESFKRLADALDRIASLANQMRNQLGAMLGEVITGFAPVIERLINKVTAAASYLTELFAALSGEDTYLQAVLVSKAWDDATDSAKKYKQQLLGIDEINNLTTKKVAEPD